jgi:hypothetical protein
MMNPQAFPMLRQGLDLGFHIITSPRTICKITRGSPAKDKDNNYNRKSDDSDHVLPVIIDIDLVKTLKQAADFSPLRSKESDLRP